MWVKGIKNYSGLVKKMHNKHSTTRLKYIQINIYLSILYSYLHNVVFINQTLNFSQLINVKIVTIVSLVAMILPFSKWHRCQIICNWVSFIPDLEQFSTVSVSWNIVGRLCATWMNERQRNQFFCFFTGGGFDRVLFSEFS